MRKLILYSLAAVMNLAVLLIIIINSFSRLYLTFLYLTILSFTFSTFYMVTMWIYEIRLHLSKSNPDKVARIRECKYYRTMRERVFLYAFTINVTVCIGYWGLCLGGKNVMQVSEPILLNLYIHFFIGVQLVLDLLLTERYHHRHLMVKDYLLAAAVICVYSTFLTIVSRSYEISVYPFLKLELYQITGVNLILFLISFNVYQFLHYVLGKKNKNSSKTENSGVNVNFIEDGEKAYTKI